MLFPNKQKPVDRFLDIDRAASTSVSTMPRYGNIATRKLSPTEMLSDMDNGSYFPPEIADREVIPNNPYGKINSAYDTDMLYNPRDTLKSSIMGNSINTPEVINNTGVAIPANPNNSQIYDPNAVIPPVNQLQNNYSAIPSSPILGNFTGKTAYPPGTDKVYNTPTGNIKFFQRGSDAGYRVKDGNKNKVTNNAMNVIYTKGSKLPAGAVGVLQSPHNGKDSADSFILAFESMEAGFANSKRLLSTPKYYNKNGGLNTAFQKWSHANYVWKGKQRIKNNDGSYKKSAEYKGKLTKLHKLGIDTSENFTDLTNSQQQLFMETMADFEGKWR